MTANNSFLVLNRLVVYTHAGKTAYDEKFFRGVNIIRGFNSSGKSTIANFIFYVLGGDFTNWTNEAKKCANVYAEVEINNAIITLKRDIEDTYSRPMWIYWGKIDDALKSASQNWEIYPYRLSDNKKSFSNILFNLLDYPEIKADNSNITMHQILRLLYIDQDSPTQSLFRYEQFDTPLNRQTISELLLGIYDDTLYDNRLRVKDLERELSSLNKEFSGIKRLYKDSDFNINKIVLENELSSANQELENSRNEIEVLKKKNIIRFTKNSKLKSEIIKNELIQVKNEINKYRDEIEFLENEIFDSEKFIESLGRRLDAINDSLATRESLGELILSHCPVCLSPLVENNSETHCALCHNPKDADNENTQARRIKQEIEFQLSESQTLLKNKKLRFQRLKEEIIPILEKGRQLQQELNIELKSAQSSVDEKLESLFVYKGKLENKIENISKLMKTSERFEFLKSEIERIEKEIKNLNLLIEDKENSQKASYYKAMDTISKYSKFLLANDLDRQGEFKNPQKIDVNFYDNSISLNDSFNFSASSNIYFKNAVRFALFFASMKESFFRYPRFILCDNMEDKGMEKERTQNFQNIIVRLSSQFKGNYQLIFTTSMISEALNTEQYCRGEYYTEKSKTLKHV